MHRRFPEHLGCRQLYAPARYVSLCYIYNELQMQKRKNVTSLLPAGHCFRPPPCRHSLLPEAPGHKKENARNLIDRRRSLHQGRSLEMVLGGGLEPPRISPHAPQACVYAISPPEQRLKTGHIVPNATPHDKPFFQKNPPRERCRHRLPEMRLPPGHTGSAFGPGKYVMRRAAYTPPGPLTDDTPIGSAVHPSAVFPVPGREAGSFSCIVTRDRGHVPRVLEVKPCAARVVHVNGG